MHGETTVATLRIAVPRPKRNGREQGADFFDVTTFGAQAENVVRYLATGRRSPSRADCAKQSWEQDGRRRQRVEIVADPYGITFLDAPRERDYDEIDAREPADVEDIPF